MFHTSAEWSLSKGALALGYNRRLMEQIKKKSAGQSGCDNNEIVRTKVVKFYCSPDEHQKIAELAKETGAPTVAQFAREKVLSDGSHKTKATLNALRKCQFELNRIGNNLNQISKFLHCGFELDRATYGALKDIKKLAFKILENVQKGDWGNK